MLTKKYLCPLANGGDYCPECKKDHSCAIVDNGDNPIEKCNFAQYFYNENNEDRFVWEDEKGNCYDVVKLLEEGYHFVNGEPVYTLNHAVVKPMKPPFNT